LAVIRDGSITEDYISITYGQTRWLIRRKVAVTQTYRSSIVSPPIVKIEQTFQ